MTLKEIVQRIQESQRMAGSNPAQALKLNRELFVDLVRQDELYIVPEAEVSTEALEQKLFRPYIGPAQENDPRLFLRIFSHRDAAEAFSARLDRNQICRLDGVEMIQLAKSYFLRGVYGFLLNDGQTWAAISFPDILTDCFRDILGDPSLARPEYVTIIQFINMVRQNRYYHIQVGRQDVVDAGKPIQIRFLDKPDNIWSPERGEWIYEECSIKDLVQAAGLPENGLIYIRASKADLELSPAKLRAALCATGLADMGTQFDLDFHTEAIALDYRLEDFDVERLPFQAELAELPRVEPEPEPEPEKPAKKKKEKKPGIFAKLFAKKEKPAPEPEEDILDVSEPPPEEKPAEAEDPKKTKKVVGKLLTPKRMVKLFFGLAFLIIVAAIISHVLKPAPMDKLEKALASGDYTGAVEICDKYITVNPENQEQMLQMMGTMLDEKLAAYADDQITANQLAEVITACEKLPALANKCDAVYTQAAALERSKITYREGLVETSMSKRLSIWKGVITADTGSQRSMRANLDENAGLYKSFIFAEADQMEVGEALNALSLLQSYYPNDNEIARETKEWLDKVSKPTGKPLPGDPSVGGGEVQEAPIAVSDVYVSEEEAGHYDLHIKWRNQSGKLIKKALFTVTPLDAQGNPVVSNPSEGSPYAKYNAIFGEPCEDGFEMPDGLFWPDAWVNTDSEIVAFKLDFIQVWYEEDDSWSDSTEMRFGKESEDPNTQEGGDSSAGNPLTDLLTGRQKLF